jgi:hypothetical protein
VYAVHPEKSLGVRRTPAYTPSFTPDYALHLQKTFKKIINIMNLSNDFACNI